MRSRGTATFAAISAGAITILIATLGARAQAPAPRSGIQVPAMPANEREVFLVRQDQSDCTNTTVPGGDSPNVDGKVLLTRGTDGNTTVQVAMTVSPNTT